MDKYSLEHLTDKRILIKNTVLYVFGQALPILAALFAIPLLIKGLGIEKFGVLTLTWMILGYFTLFDLGISRALIQSICEKIGCEKKEEIPAVIWASLSLLLIFSLLGGIILFLIAHLLVGYVFKVPADMSLEVLQSIYLIALSLPIVLLASGFQGVLNAFQRADLISVVKIPMSIFSYVGPLFILPFTNSLFWVTFVLLLGRLINLAVSVLMCFSLMPELKKKILIQRTYVISLINFGGWMTVTNIIGPIMIYLDRFLIGALISLSSVAYYVTPYELAVKLFVIPVSLAGVVFPAFSTTYARNKEKTAKLFMESIKYTAIILLPIVIFLIIFAKEGFFLWLGSDFSKNSSFVFQLLLVGVFINSIGHIPFALIQGVGRPDLTAKLHLAELPFYLISLLVSIKLWGISGVAAVWSLRVLLDTIFLFAITRKIMNPQNISSASGNRCPLCGSDGDQLYNNLKDRLYGVPGEWGFKKCKNKKCGLLWLIPRPDESEIAKLYGDYYTHGANAGDRKNNIYSSIKKLFKAFNNAVKFVFGMLSEQEEMGAMFLSKEKPGKLLEIGSGNGSFLNTMRKKGWQVEGVEIDEQSANYARGRFGLKIRIGDVFSAGYPDNVFDAVTMCHVLEHVISPVELLKEVHRILKPNGKIIIVTPNSNSLLHKMFKNNWRGLEPPRHFFIYSKENLEIIARKAGFSGFKIHSENVNSAGVFRASLDLKLRGKHKPTSNFSIISSVAASLVQYCLSIVSRVFKDSGDEMVLIASK